MASLVSVQEFNYPLLNTHRKEADIGLLLRSLFHWNSFHFLPSFDINITMNNKPTSKMYPGYCFFVCVFVFLCVIWNNNFLYVTKLSVCYNVYQFVSTLKKGEEISLPTPLIRIHFHWLLAYPPELSDSLLPSPVARWLWLTPEKHPFRLYSKCPREIRSTAEHPRSSGL